MNRFERGIIKELRKLREAEAALQANFEKLPKAGADAERYFLASLRSLDRQVSQFELFLERVA